MSNYFGPLIATFVLLLIVIALFLVSFFRLRSVPPSSETFPDPNIVACSEDAILEAWIHNIPNKQSCPPFTNNYVIGEGYHMYEKDFLVDGESGCCWYSNDIEDRKLFPHPWICNGSDRVFSLNELNTRPYFYDGITVLYPNPTCDTDPACISLIRVGSVEDAGIYKATKFRTESTIVYEEGEELPPPDSSADYARRLKFYISDSCRDLKRIIFDDQLVLERTPGGDYAWYDINPELRPDIAVVIVDIFRRDRFYPIAGANPPLSEFAANTK